jgi:hypothetical protein
MEMRKIDVDEVHDVITDPYILEILLLMKVEGHHNVFLGEKLLLISILTQEE